MLVVKNLQTKFLHILKKHYPLLVCWGSVTLIHLNKAFQIDDIRQGDTIKIHEN
jgi:hypothetical protein